MTAIERLSDLLREAALPAALAAALVGAWILLARLLGRPRRPPAPSPEDLERLAALCEEVRRLELGLRELSAEVEARLDAKLDRLEALVAETRRAAGLALPEAREPAGAAEATGATGATGATEEAAEAASELSPASAGSSPLSSVTAGDRERVLQLASLGKLPEAIAQSVGLLRGEVDLILRLHRIAERGRQA